MVTDLRASGDVSRTFRHTQDFESSFEIQQDDVDSDVETRRNNAAYKQLSNYHVALAEKLYSELCSLAFGEFDTASNEISPIMWTRLYNIFVEIERRTRHMPSDAKISIQSQRIASEAVQITSVLAIYAALPHEYAATRETSLLSHLILDDVEFRRIYALLLWSEKAISEQQYELGISKKVGHLECAGYLRNRSIAEFKRALISGPSSGASFDPDARGTDEDFNNEQRAMLTMFQLIRCGEAAKAAELAMKCGMGPLAAQLRLHAMLRNPDDVPLEVDSKNHAKEKRQHRAMYFKMLSKMIEMAKRDEDDAHMLLLNAMRGSLHPMLKIAETIVEKVWAHANAAFIGRLLAAEGSLSVGEAERLFNVPLTAKSILDELDAENRRTGEVLVLTKVIDYMLNDEIDELFALAKHQCEGYIPNYPNSGVNPITLDLFFHLVCVSYLKGYEMNDHGTVVVTSEFADLRHRFAPHRRMAAFYSRFLPRDSPQINFEIMETMKIIDTESEREIFAQSLRECELDFGKYACSLIKLRDEMMTIDEQIERWQWVLVGKEETALAAVEEMNRLIRNCLLEDKWETNVRSILRKAFEYNLPGALSGVMCEPPSSCPVLSLSDDEFDGAAPADAPETLAKVEHAMQEFVAHCTFMDLHNYMVTIALKTGIAMNYEPVRDEELEAIGGLKIKESRDWEASLRVRARAEMTLREEAMKRKTIDANARREMISQHIRNAMPLFESLLRNNGWRGEFFLAPRSTGDPMKRHRMELAKIRARFVPEFFRKFAIASAKIDEMLPFYDFLSSFDVDSGDLGIAHEEIRRLFETLANLNVNTEQN
ncbi:unnamed protein product [Caenorhabditis bovis]|uniref:Nuclear pore complex protein n=1 Tax=Caenorhabditis bovis TaxID=2654633 RepID=A0A8S1EV76_9PELO|nr:unnamed protein product [Caenorhabditis bovis]